MRPDTWIRKRGPKMPQRPDRDRHIAIDVRLSASRSGDVIADLLDEFLNCICLYQVLVLNVRKIRVDPDNKR